MFFVIKNKIGMKTIKKTETLKFFNPRNIFHQTHNSSLFTADNGKVLSASVI